MPYGGVECEKNSVEKPERLGAAYLSNLIDGRLITLNPFSESYFPRSG